MPGARRLFERGLAALAVTLAWLAALIMMSGIVAITVAGVVMRRFFDTPLHVTEDVVGLMLSAALFLALPLVTLRVQHVRVGIVADALRARLDAPMRVAAMLVGAAFFGWILIDSLAWFEFAWRRGLKSETARLLLYPWMAVLPLSVGLTCTIYTARLLGLLPPERYGAPEDIPQMVAPGKDG